MWAQIEKTKFNRDTRLAIISEFLGFGLEACDMALVICMVPGGSGGRCATDVGEADF